MIVSIDSEAQLNDFEGLLTKSVSVLHDKSSKEVKYFLSRTGTKLEEDVFDAMELCSKDTPFEGNLEMISGQRFPDIVAYLNKSKGFGVEVKTTNRNHWKSTGNSVFEGTRVENVERIYLFFGKLVAPIEFRYKRYEDCLYDVAVTHSPRYLIDMETPPKETIFNKIGVSYDKLRGLSNPFNPIKEYFRKHVLNEGDDIWWIDPQEEVAGNIVIKLWSNIDKDTRNKLIIESMTLFPEIYSSYQKKYHRVASWLVVNHGIVCPNVRDEFSASGQVNIKCDGKIYSEIPKVFGNLEDNIKHIIEFLEQVNDDYLSYYWNTEIKENKIEQWIELVSKYSESQLKTTGLDISTMIKERIESK